MLRCLGYTLLTVLVLAVISVLFYLDYTAYRQRFPNAAPWTYLFRGRR